MLIEDAENRYAKTMQHQSQSLAEAVTEYTRRYRRFPPKGFGDWYNIAKSHSVQNIDNYDTVTQTLDLYRKIHPKELRESIASVLREGKAIQSISMEDGRLRFWEDGFPFSEEISYELKPYLKVINDLQAPILLNRLHDIDTPRVLIPYEVGRKIYESSLAEAYGDKPNGFDGTPFRWTDLTGQQSWQVVSGACAPDSQFRQQQRTRPNETDLDFISDPSIFKDVCKQPELQYLHGLFMSAPVTRVTFQPIPIFSGAKTSLSSDILIPNPYYGKENMKNANHSTRPWAEKRPILYWSGSTTGSAATNQDPNLNWHLTHRNRFVELANGLGDAENATATLLRQLPLSNKWEPYTTSFALQRHFYNISFSRLVKCDEATTCNDMKSFYQPSGAYTGWVDRWRIDDYAFLLDMDGNGFSGRFYRLLGSNATVFKSTIFQEWHDDQSSAGGLMPWVHYVPISIGMQEVPELMRFFTSSKQGRAYAARIADRGKRWVDERGRREDLGAGLARMVLEYKRLVSDERDTGAMDHKRVKNRTSGWWLFGGRRGRVITSS